MRLIRQVADTEDIYVAGSTGTVVYVYDDGAAFEVELFFPKHGVVTVEREDVERLSI